MESKLSEAELADLIEAVRACARELRFTIGELHNDLGVTAAVRSVKEHLRQKGPSTVPDIARAKSVSRQNIQVIVDSLLQSGLVSIKPNPVHKRSSLVALTKKGESTFDEVLRRGHVPVEPVRHTGREGLRTGRPLLDGERDLGEHLAGQREEDGFADADRLQLQRDGLRKFAQV